MKNTTIWDYTYRFVIWENYANRKPTLAIYATYKNNKEKYVQWYYYQDMEQLEKSKEKFIQTKKDRIARNEQYKAERKIKTNKANRQTKVVTGKNGRTRTTTCPIASMEGVRLPLWY